MHVGNRTRSVQTDGRTQRREEQRQGVERTWRDDRPGAETGKLTATAGAQRAETDRPKDREREGERKRELLASARHAATTTNQKQNTCGR